MDIIEELLRCFVAIILAALPISWCWCLFYKIKCRKACNCKNRQCHYWQFCNHNEFERQKEIFEIRIKMIQEKLGNVVEK